MAINELFPNPTVKKVIFQIRFPELFAMEAKIGEFQLEIMEEFPKSSLLHRQALLFANVGPGEEIVKPPVDFGKEGIGKTWRFESGKEYDLNVQAGSLDLSSGFHITYSLAGAPNFRDIIEYVLDRFFKITQIPIVNRVGLRYIDECPLPHKTNTKLKTYYNTAFPLQRFDIGKASEMNFKAVVKKGKYNLRYIESLQANEGKHKLILDFDAFAENIPSKRVLTVTDALHEIISNEYDKTIKEPVKRYMRKKKRAKK